jgi:hypothetical protein
MRTGLDFLHFVYPLFRLLPPSSPISLRVLHFPLRVLLLIPILLPSIFLLPFLLNLGLKVHVPTPSTIIQLPTVIGDMRRVGRIRVRVHQAIDHDERAVHAFALHLAVQVADHVLLRRLADAHGEEVGLRIARQPAARDKEGGLVTSVVGEQQQSGDRPFGHGVDAYDGDLRGPK